MGGGSPSSWPCLGLPCPPSSPHAKAAGSPCRVGGQGWAGRLNKQRARGVGLRGESSRVPSSRGVLLGEGRSSAGAEGHLPLGWVGGGGDQRGVGAA